MVNQAESKAKAVATRTRNLENKARMRAALPRVRRLMQFFVSHRLVLRPYALRKLRLVMSAEEAQAKWVANCDACLRIVDSQGPLILWDVSRYIRAIRWMNDVVRSYEIDHPPRNRDEKVSLASDILALYKPHSDIFRLPHPR